MMSKLNHNDIHFVCPLQDFILCLFKGEFQQSIVDNS